MEKEYVRIQWENRPSIATPLGQINLNKMDYQIDKNENTLITFDTTKANQSDLLQTIRTLTYDTETGIFVFTFWNGSTYSVDLNIEKIPVTFSMDEYGVITMTTADGTTYTCDIGALIKLYTFVDGDEIDFVTTTDAGGNKTITASIKDGSIVGSKLQPNFLADCQAAKAQAELAASSASSDASDAESSSEDSEAWAVGERNGQPVPSTDPAYENNAKYWAQHGTGSSFAGLSDTNFTNLQNGQIAKYNSTTQKWENTEDEGGLLPHFKITSEAGSTVTVVCPDTSVIVPTQTSSGIWQCDVPAYGVYIVHAVINGDDAVRTVTVDTVKEYVIHDEHYSYTLNVYAPTGSSIIVTDGDDETYTGTGAGSTAVIFALHQASTTYTIEVTYDGLERDTTITSSATTGGSGSKTIEFGTINLTLDEDLIGETIVMTNGTATKSKVADSTSMVFYPNATGNWTISCEYDGETYYSEPNPVVVSSLSTPVSAEISLMRIPEGATVTPTDDIQTWLACANITNKSYTTLAEVLADRETFETLIANSNACKYMARSTTWAGDTTVKVPTMTSNTAPSGECSASSNFNNKNYPTWKAFDNNTSTQWLTTTVSASTVSYIQYKFSEARIVNTVKMIFENWASGSMATISNISIKGSNDGSNFTPLHSYQPDNDKNQLAIFDNNDSYLYYRVEITGYNAINTQAGIPSNVSIAELQFYQTGITTSQDAMARLGKFDYASNLLLSDSTWSEAITNSDYTFIGPLVPTMTSNNTPEGTCICSSEQSSYKAYMAFDGNNSTEWMDSHSGVYASDIYVGYTFTKKCIVTKYYILYDQAVNCTYKLQGSNDGENWVDIGSQSTLLNGYVQVPNATAYLSYRIYIISAQYPNQQYGQGRVVTLQFYGKALEEVLVPLVPTMTSATTPSGEVISSGHSTNYDAWKAFDNDDTTEAAVSAAVNGYIGYRFVNPTCVNAFRIYDNNTKRLLTFKIQASNTGGIDDWIDISDVMTMPSSYDYTAEIRKNGILNTESYYYYRVLQVTTSFSANIAYKTIQFYQKQVQTNIIHSAPNDYIYMLEDWVPTPICRTNEDGDGIFDFSELEEGVYTFGSTVAKNPNDLTEDFKKRIRITKTPYGGTTELYLLPDTIDTLYWFGYESDNLEDLSTANGWSYSRTLSSPTRNQTSLEFAAPSQGLVGVGSSKELPAGTIAKNICQGVTAASGTYGGFAISTTKALTFNQEVSDTSTSIVEQQIKLSASGYPITYSDNGRKQKCYGLWYDRASNDIPTFISAANDSLYIMDGNTKVYVANTNGEGKSYEPMLLPGTYTIYSSVAKDPNNLSNPYSKTVTVDESTQTIAVMPDAVKTLYWWGYEGDNFEDCLSANGWSLNASGWSFANPTHNTNNILMNPSTNQACGCGAKQSITANKNKCIASATGTAHSIHSSYAKNNASENTAEVNTPTSLSTTQINGDFTTNIPWVATSVGSTLTLYALWCE